MQKNDMNMLKKLSKDEQSFEKLKEIVGNLIEERDKKAEHLRMLESAIRSDYDSILITELNLQKPGPKIVYVNDGFCEMTGYSKDEVIGKTPRILQGPKTDRKVLDRLKRKLREGQSFFGQTINYRKDGSEFVMQWDIHPLTDKDGNVTHWISYQQDISERKRAEEQIIDTKVEFDNLRKESRQTVVDIDLQGNIVMANRAFRELTGYKKDELKRLKIWDLFPDKYMKSLKGRFDSVRNSYFDGEEFKGIINHKSGVPIQVKGHTRILDLRDQKLIRAEIENISLQKRIIDTLKKRNFDFSKIVEKAAEFSYSITFDDDNPVVEAVSETFPKITGLSHDAVLGKNTLNKILHEDDLEKFRAHLQDVKGGKNSTCEYRLKCKSGNYIEVLDYAKPEWKNEKTKVLSVRGAVSVDGAYQDTGTQA
jgi:PAS domain S-box-containing protein